MASKLVNLAGGGGRWQRAKRRSTHSSTSRSRYRQTRHERKKHGAPSSRCRSRKGVTISPNFKAEFAILFGVSSQAQSTLSPTRLSGHHSAKVVYTSHQRALIRLCRNQDGATVGNRSPDLVFACRRYLVPPYAFPCCVLPCCAFPCCAFPCCAFPCHRFQVVRFHVVRFYLAV